MKRTLLTITVASLLLTSSINVQAHTNKTASKAKATTYNLNTSSSRIELLDWWESASRKFSVGTTAKITDIDSGKSFWVKRTSGTNHADSEALTTNDTNIIKVINFN